MRIRIQVPKCHMRASIRSHTRGHVFDALMRLTTKRVNCMRIRGLQSMVYSA